MGYTQTIENLLHQCEELAWIERPQSTKYKTHNYILTSKGEAIIAPLLKGEGWYIHYGSEKVLIFKKPTLNIIDDIVKYWIGKPPEDLQRKFPDILRKAQRSEVPVPHYDLSDSGLRPFLEGAEGKEWRRS